MWYPHTSNKLLSPSLSLEKWIHFQNWQASSSAETWSKIWPQVSVVRLPRSTAHTLKSSPRIFGVSTSCIRNCISSYCAIAAFGGVTSRNTITSYIYGCHLPLLGWICGSRLTLIVVISLADYDIVWISLTNHSYQCILSLCGQI